MARSVATPLAHSAQGLYEIDSCRPVQQLRVSIFLSYFVRLPFFIPFLFSFSSFEKSTVKSPSRPFPQVRQFVRAITLHLYLEFLYLCLE